MKYTSDAGDSVSSSLNPLRKKCSFLPIDETTDVSILKQMIMDAT